MPIDLSTEQLTKIYNDANGILGGKNPPISTERIFKAMQACYAMGAEEQKEKDAKICEPANMDDTRDWTEYARIKAECAEAIRSQEQIMTDFQFNLMLIGSSMAVSIASTWIMWKLLDFVCHFKDCDSTLTEGDSK